MEPSRCLTPPLQAPPPQLALQVGLAPFTPAAAARDDRAINIVADKCSPPNTSDGLTTSSSCRTSNSWSSALLQMPLIDRFYHSATIPAGRRQLPPSNRSINLVRPPMNLQSTQMEDDQKKTKKKNMIVTSVLMEGPQSGYVSAHNHDRDVSWPTFASPVPVLQRSPSGSGNSIRDRCISPDSRPERALRQPSSWRRSSVLQSSPPPDLELLPAPALAPPIPAAADNLTVMIMDRRDLEGISNNVDDSSSSCCTVGCDSDFEPQIIVSSTQGKDSISNVETVRCVDDESSSSSCSDGTSTTCSGAAVGIAWRDLWVTVSGASGGRDAAGKVVLHGVTGYAEAGKVLAIMGPSGCGKSTLLDALAGRLGKRARMSGDVSVMSSRESGKSAAAWQGRGIAYVRQEDTLLGTLTVRETLAYSARMRIKSKATTTGTSERMAMSMVEEAMEVMGLVESAETPVGNWHLRGLSGGEKRRLSIALEILTRPDLLFLDEPTSGLDSASAFFVTATLRRLARDGHRSVVAAIHQPSSQVFALFDSLCLLSDGRLVFFGDKDLATQHFANAGFPCPPHRNPSDHYLCSINSDFDGVKSSLAAQKLVGMEWTSSSSSLSADPSFPPLEKVSSTEMANILVSRYAGSMYAEVARSRADEFMKIMHQQRQEKKRRSSSMCGCIYHQQPAGNDDDAAAASPAMRASIGKMSVITFWMQTWTLTRRSFVNMRRDVGYYWLRLLIYILLTASIGSIYFDIGTTYQSVMARASCISYVTGFLTFMSIGGFPSFVEDMKVFSREQSNGHYGVVPFVLANLLSALPYLSFISLVSSSICYFMVGLHPGISHFVYFVLCLLACLAVVESLMMVVASIVPNFLMGIITGAGIQGIFMLVAGFFRLPNDMPKPIWRYPLSYLSFHMYAMQGMYQNDFLGLKFEAGKWEGAPAVEGELILETMYEVDLKRSKWWDLWVLVVMVFMYRLIFLLVVKFSQAYDTWRQSGGGNTSTAPPHNRSASSSSSSSSPSSSPSAAATSSSSKPRSSSSSTSSSSSPSNDHELP